MFEIAVSLNQMMMGLSSAIMHYNVDVGDAHVIVIVYYDIDAINELILHTLERVLTRDQEGHMTHKILHYLSTTAFRKI